MEAYLPILVMCIYVLVLVEDTSSDCSALPEFVDEKPVEDVVISVLPYEEVKFNITIRSGVERYGDTAVLFFHNI